MWIVLLVSIFGAFHIRLSGHQSVQIDKNCQDLPIFSVFRIHNDNAVNGYDEISGRFSCFHVAKEIYLRGAKNCKKLFNKADKLFGEKACRFNFDATQKVIEPQTSGIPLAETHSNNIAWTCKLNSTNFCDGFSDCLTDECGCHGNQTDVFYCADGSGCITWDKICDDIQDCLDGSDECSCPGHVVFSTSGNKVKKVCMSEESYCHTKTYLQQMNMTPEILDDEIGCEAYNKHHEASKFSPLETCLFEAWDEGFMPYFRASAEAVREYCSENCSHVAGFNDGWKTYCDRIDVGSVTFFEFLCSKNDYREYYDISSICDGELDCSNHADEMGCPLSDRFYCNPNVSSEWVGKDKLCDNIKDCANGTDECDTCEFEALSSSKFLIHSKIILAITSIMGILIVLLNVRQGYKCSRTASTSKNKAIDRMILLQIFFYDTLMGLYLCSIVVAGIVLNLKGDYCNLERKWRGSHFCAVLGVLFSFSSHGSLLAIAFISLTRFLTCQSLLAEMSIKAVVIASVLVTLINLLHSVLPILPVSAVKDVFRTGLFFTNLKNNPFFNTNPVNMTRLADVYKEMLHREKNDAYTMLKHLSNITSKTEIFDVTEISYYGNTGLCVHNIFKEQNTDDQIYKIYKILYCVVILLMLTLVSTAYIKIVLKQRKSAEALNKNAADVGNAGGVDSKTTDLAVKVALMIGSQLACWIPFILVVMYFQFFTSKPASSTVFEVFALVLIPMNSFLNPVFYSGLYKKIRSFIQYSLEGARRCTSTFRINQGHQPDVGVSINVVENPSLPADPQDGIGMKELKGK